jgi:hypothetical protein
MNYYVEYWDCGNDQRNTEVIDCINNNINSKLFDNIFIFSSSHEPRINHDVILTNRITYQFIFDNAQTGVNVLANSDILFNETIKLAEIIKENEFYGITRYEEDGNRHKHDDPYHGYDSQDVWVWKDKCKIKDANFFLGVPGCDNKIAYHANLYGYSVKNPALSIKTYHKHTTNVRDGTSSNLSHRLPPPYALISIESI